MSFTAIYVVDFDTLDILLQAADAASSETSTISEHVVKTATLIRSLRIILRLPLATCEAIEHARNLTSSVSSLNKAYTWMRLCSAITGLQGLRRLHIWLDHEDKSSWSVVHERAILSPLSTLTNVSNLNISVNLPKLHPILETPERHFMKETPAPPFSIERRRPQQYHSVPDSGALAVEYFPDFPCYSDFDYAWSLTNDEVEELEREMWKNGEDVQADALVRTLFIFRDLVLFNCRLISGISLLQS
jgi:hypothetical protein